MRRGVGKPETRKQCLSGSVAEQLNYAVSSCSRLLLAGKDNFMSHSSQVDSGSRLPSANLVLIATELMYRRSIPTIAQHHAIKPCARPFIDMEVLLIFDRKRNARSASPKKSPRQSTRNLVKVCPQTSPSMIHLIYFCVPQFIAREIRVARDLCLF